MRFLGLSEKFTPGDQPIELHSMGMLGEGDHLLPVIILRLLRVSPGSPEKFPDPLDESRFCTEMTVRVPNALRIEDRRGATASFGITVKARE